MKSHALFELIAHSNWAKEDRIGDFSTVLCPGGRHSPEKLLGEYSSELSLSSLWSDEAHQL